MAFRIVTNNPQVQEHFGERHQIHWIEGNYLAVLEFVRDEVHRGYPVLTHLYREALNPMKPLINPSCWIQKKIRKSALR